jgi:hypothetical protein
MEGVKIPIRGYERVIDTGDHQPIAVTKLHYGMHEASIMQNTIEQLLDMGFIVKDSISPWGFRITLAPKPHQENVTEIENYVWRFCTNYIRLNMITRPAEYPIPRCDDAVMFGFGQATHYILLDAYSGYHQIRLSPASAIKTAFYAPHGRKYMWVVMPFGLRNCPSVFIAMMHDLKQLWTSECEKAGIIPSHDKGTTIIMDDTLLYAVSIDHTFIIIRCVCLIARKYHLTWKLIKAQWFPESVEFVGVDMKRSGGNVPARSKHVLLHNWKAPSTARAYLSFVGFAIFYLKWMPSFELKIAPIRKIIKDYGLDEKLIALSDTTKANQVYEYVKAFHLSEPIPQRANIHKTFYLKKDFSALGFGYALCQPDDTPEALAAMRREDEGGKCEFGRCRTKLRLKPCSFGARKTIGNEEHFHSHPGKCTAATWSITKNRHYLWGRPFSLISDCEALMWLLNYKGHNHAVIRLQLELLGYWFTIGLRAGDLMEDANYFSRLGEDIHSDPLMTDYLSFQRQLYDDNAPAKGEVNDQNTPGRRSKKARIEEVAEQVDSPNRAIIDFANIDWHQLAPQSTSHQSMTSTDSSSTCRSNSRKLECRNQHPA